jgi:hypothetical protein
MEDTGVTKEGAGRLYKCTKCGKKRYTCFGLAHDHYPEHCSEAEVED